MTKYPTLTPRSLNFHLLLVYMRIPAAHNQRMYKPVSTKEPLKHESCQL